MILSVVRNVVQQILQSDLFASVKHTDSRNGDSVRCQTSVLTFDFGHRLMLRLSNTVKVVVYRSSLFLTRISGRVTVLDILNHLADRICQQRVTLGYNLSEVFYFRTIFLFD